MELKAISKILMLTFLFSCSSANQEGQNLLDKAYEKQKEVIKLIKSLEEKLDTSSHPKNDSLLGVIEELEEGIFAISGHTHDLPGQEGHDHDHSKIVLSTE